MIVCRHLTEMVSNVVCNWVEACILIINDCQHVGLFINHDVTILKIVVAKTNPVVIA
uniref:Uncharacterized protein n=1 Tax=Arundo donax TaxID=35708 RepID=A0A0A9EC62_ARUDO